MDHTAVIQATKDRVAHVDAAHNVYSWRLEQANQLKNDANDAREQASEQEHKLRELANAELNASLREASDRYHATMAEIVDGGENGGGNNGIG